MRWGVARSWGKQFNPGVQGSLDAYELEDRVVEGGVEDAGGGHTASQLPAIGMAEDGGLPTCRAPVSSMARLDSLSWDQDHT